MLAIQPDLNIYSKPNNKRAVANVVLPMALPEYSYLIPDDMNIAVGSYVYVSLGARKVVGVVCSIDFMNVDELEYKLKPIESVFSEHRMPEVQLRFIFWVADYNFIMPGIVFKMAIPDKNKLVSVKNKIGYIFTGIVPGVISEQRQKVLSLVAAKEYDDKIWSIEELIDSAGVSNSVLNGLLKLGVFSSVELPDVVFKQTLSKDIADNIITKGIPQELTREQTEAASKLKANITNNSFSVSLIDGITGSGKTEVYFEIIAHTLEQGKQVLVLLPEISLTFQFVKRISNRFGIEVGQWHSSIPKSSKNKTWRLISQGKVKLIVGARSALFLPFQNLGLIVVDEEHESSYKQEDGAIYHARDMAVAYGFIGAFPVLLASATPSLETLKNVLEGRYHKVTLNSRYGQSSLPDISIIDMRDTKLPAGKLVSPLMAQEIAGTISRGEQVLIFINRRGYAPLTLCRKCGYHFECPECSVYLVEHRQINKMICHHCGYTQSILTICPGCDTKDSLAVCGVGIERLADEIGELFPEITPLLLSSDLVTNKELPDLLTKVENCDYQIIIGTQLIAKGHNFPQLTLTCILDADTGLNNVDHRASERTYQLLCQVAGRAGRSNLKGKAIIQSYNPEHPLLQSLLSGKRDQFINFEINLRKKAKLPPYGKLVGIIISSSNQDMAMSFARKLMQMRPDVDNSKITVLGPAPAPLFIIRSRYRYRILIKTTRNFNIQSYLQLWLIGIKSDKNIRISVDIDPYNFL